MTILQRYPDLDVVAGVNDTEAALLRVSETGAGVVLVDAGLGDNDSRDLVQRIVREFAPTRVIVMDILPEPEEIVEFVRAGASGFVVKEASVEVFIDTIRAVAAGGQVLPRALTNTIFAHIAKGAVANPTASVARSVKMTSREQQVIDLIAEGMSNKLIARSLRISTHTVKSHVRNILEKLALHSRLQVAAYAHRAALRAENQEMAAGESEQAP